MNSESERSAGTISSDMRAIWAGALLLCYLIGTAALLVARIGTVGIDIVLWHCVVLAAVAATIVVPRTPPWVRLWTPLVLLLFLYSELPALIAAAGHQNTMDPLILGWEQAIFGANLPGPGPPACPPPR